MGINFVVSWKPRNEDPEDTVFRVILVMLRVDGLNFERGEF